MHLVQKINLQKFYPDCPIKELYMYGEASTEANLAMQEPLKKLYEYENQKNTPVKNQPPDKAETYLVLNESGGATVTQWYEPNGTLVQRKKEVTLNIGCQDRQPQMKKESKYGKK